MSIKFFALGLVVTMMFISCNNNNEEATTINTEINIDTTQKIRNEISSVQRDSIIKKLEGEWKEPSYPFRVAHFKNSTVKFIEEGVVEEPTYKEYNISKECPYNVNNIKNAVSNDLFLVMVEDRTCEILKISNDTLTLNGFNINTNSDYNIIYKKVK